MRVRDRDNRRKLTFQYEKHTEWKTIEEGSSKFTRDDRKAQRPFLDPCERCAKCSDEFRAKALPFAVVPQCCIKSVKLSLRPNLQPRHLPTRAQTQLKSLDDVFPWLAFLRCSTMCREAFLQNGLLPSLEWNLIDARRDMVPKRLDVVDLLFDRQCVEPRGRQRQGMGHSGTIPPACRLFRVAP